MIIFLCDCYDAAVDAHQEQLYSPEKVYKSMSSQRDSFPEPELLERFLKVFGFWPVGTILLLTDGEIGIVREQNESDLLAPTIEIVSPQENRRFADLKELKEEMKIEMALNPFAEGQEYIKFI
jgi:hypothetical protein